MTEVPLVSVLLPTRGRPDSLRFSVESLLERASVPQDIELLLAIDPDDDIMREAGPLPAARVWTAPERFGYEGLYRYFNHLATLATGDWLMLWNDDARMLTSGWDDIIRQQERWGVLASRANHCGDANLFPVFPRWWTEVTGHISLSPNVDVWIQEVGAMLGACSKVPIEVFHDRFDVTGNHDDQTYREGRALQEHLNFNHPSHDTLESRGLRIRDAMAIDCHSPRPCLRGVS
jgi:hypothetical protein